MAWNAVPLGEDHLKEFLMFSYDVPASRNFIPHACMNFNERARRVMKSHPEFMNLPDYLQMQVWNRNLTYGAAITCAKLEACETGIEQFRYAYTQDEKDLVLKEFPMIPFQSLKTLKTFASNKTAKLYKDDVASKIHKLFLELAPIFQDDTSFKLFMMYFMFSDFDHVEELRKLKSRYLQLYLRKKGMNLDLESKSLQTAFGLDSYNSMSLSIKKIKELNSLMAHMRTQ